MDWTDVPASTEKNHRPVVLLTDEDKRGCADVAPRSPAWEGSPAQPATGNDELERQLENPAAP